MKPDQNKTILHAQNDYSVKYFYHKESESKNPFNYNHKTNSNNYSIVCILNGNFKIKKNLIIEKDVIKKEENIRSGTIIISPPSERIEIELLSDFWEFIIIDFLPIIFKNTLDEKDIFRIFKHSKFKSIYKTNEFSSNFVKECIDSLKDCLVNAIGRFHTLLRIRTLVSQLDLELDKILGKSRTEEESVLVRTISYIEENYAKNLTLDSVSNYLGISKSSINRICKKMVQKTFLEYLTDIRLEKSLSLLRNPYSTVKSVAILSGFNSYNSFYHAFVKKFGYPPLASPSGQKTKGERNNWPFETSNYFLNDEYK